LLLYLPAAAWLFTAWRRGKLAKAAAKMPFSELRRRPAGESLRLELEKLDEQIDGWLVSLTVTPILLAVGLTFQSIQTLPTVILFFLTAAIATAIAARKLQPILEKRRDYLLGYQGERYVAEELNLLMAEGFHVFHDVPFENYNIDHVLVGPSGAFAVETKTRRKRTADGKENYKVLFDGTRLNFPSGWDTKALDQARLNAKTLSQWLGSATADLITAKAILTIPGWFVERSARSDVYVTSPKQIRSYILNLNENPLTPAEIQRAHHQLEQRCKVFLD